MEDFITLEINEGSSTPKYRQIVASVINKIESGQLKYGKKLPSINQLSFDYYLSRDTVEKAYKELKDKGIIHSVKGKGYYIKNTNPKSLLKALIVFNKLSAYKKEIYNAMAHELKEKAHLDLFIYHCHYDLFEKIISERLEDYDHYVIMPHFIQFEIKEFENLLKKIPKHKITLLDHKFSDFDHYHNCIYQDFKSDIYESLIAAHDDLAKYSELVLVFPADNEYPYPKEIILGFRRFCSIKNFSHKIINRIDVNEELQKGAAYIVIEENDLTQLIKLQRESGIELGKDIGVLSYNETLLKEILSDGISVISTDFRNMGFLAASAIVNNKSIECKNDFKYIKRRSL